ncbi:MAG: hypothetical protein ACXW25_02310 [Rhodospirillales bacterium]|nr:hypothetical protein [Rhodospirillales bacterium]
MTPEFFGLLHLDENERSAVNVPVGSFREQIQIYVDNAVVLSETLQSEGIKFTLLTNRRDQVTELLPSGSRSLQVVEIPFMTEVPRGIKFYSAHFKIDAFKYISTLPQGYFILSDLDAICLKQLPIACQNIIDAGIPLYYDISEQVIPAYGHDTIIEDLKMVGGLEGEGRWIGGEFIGGSPSFFKQLAAKIDEVYGNYVANLGKMHHVGDEALTSAAAELLRRDGLYIADAGSIGVVARYWNTNVRHPQKPLTSLLQQVFLLHLPADKKFLADLARQGTLTASECKQRYLRYWKSPAQISNRMARRLAWSLKGLMRSATH